MIWLAMGLLIFGALSLQGGWSHRQQLAKVPRMTCDELMRNGPGADGFATLTDIKACGRGYLFHRDALCPSDVEFYVPVYAGHLQQEPQPGDLTLLLAIHDDDAIDVLISQQGTVEFTCLADRNVAWLEDWVRQGLAAKYPGLQLANCWILKVGLHEPSPFVAHRMLQAGLATVFAGGLLCAWLVWRS
jgi:hypothetical protein